MARRPEKTGLGKAYKKALTHEQKMAIINARALAAIRKAIRASTKVKGNAYNYNKKLEKAIRKQVTNIARGSIQTQKDLQTAIEGVAARAIVDASKVGVSLATVKSIIKNVDIDNFSTVMRPSLSEYREDLVLALKTSIGQGKSVVNLANELTKLDPVTVDIPKWIHDIEQAARKALKDPKHFKAFQKALNANADYINKLTRAGEPGFEHLGLRRASQKFIKDMEKAVNENTINNIVNDWAKKKALYIQKRVARTETSRAYHEALMEYADEADHIIGVEVVLSGSHPEFDSCDYAAKVYMFSEYSRSEIPIPPTSEFHHPQCLCGMLYIFDEEEVKKAA